MFWVFMIVAACFAFVLALVKMCFRFRENIERIRHGYPTLDNAEKINSGEGDEEKYRN
ncbi:MAG: hypothetical protein LBU32_07890 [Clostridiales bacterium]|jgi:hypothetical protein|nr:hypothetical protein [Clostridiales bacterium]